ncbi:hypothetical protein [Nocardia sp. NPDC059229]|uniref:hypothetical protein n=1 Tax=Nocardia sp. NPDC059229 TaxID=3346778 RepID=UPI0036ADACE7
MPSTPVLTTAAPPPTTTEAVPPSSEAKPPASTTPVPAQTSGLSLEPPAVAPGAPVQASGTGCDPGANVKLSIGGTTAADTTARADGGFAATLATGGTDIGQHEVTAECGRKLAAPLAIVLVSQVGGGAATMTVLLFFLLVGGWFYGHRLISHLPARRLR